MGPLHPSLSLPAPLVLGIPARTSHTLSLLLTTTYVGSLYVAQLVLAHKTRQHKAKQLKHRDAPAASAGETIAASDVDTQAPQSGPARAGRSKSKSREPEVGSRDHPDTIRARIRAVGVATLLSVGGVLCVVKGQGGYTWSQAIRPTLSLLGLPSSLSFGSLKALGRTDALAYILAPGLFLGPLYANYLDGDLPFQRTTAQSGSSSLFDRVQRFCRGFGLVEWRNYVVAPLTEELVFRSTILSVSLLARFSTRSLVLGTPLWFGLAHLHHAYDQWKKAGGTAAAAVTALLTCLFQFAYTTLFGWYAAYLFVRTGSVLPPLASHIFCNTMGIYSPTTAVARHPERRIYIWTAYLVGVVGFVYGLRAL